MKKTNRRRAAEELQAIYNSYELRPVTLSTIYRRMYWNGCNWCIIGYAHDYTAK